MDVVASAQARHPVRFVAADYEVALEGGLHFEIVPVAVDVILETLDAGAFRALGVKQDRAARPDRAAGVFEPFVRLAQVDIEREAAGGRDHQFAGRVDFRAEHAVDGAAAFAMGKLVVAGDDLDEAPLRAEHHVHEKIGIGHAAAFEQVFVRGVALQLPGAAVGMEDHAVIERGGAEPRDSRHQALAAARIARDQVVYDFAGENDTVGLPHLAVDFDAIPEACGADGNEVRVIGGDMVDAADARENLLADDELLLFDGLAAVNAEREDDEDVAVGDAGSVERGDDGREQQVRAGEARDVVNYDGDALAAVDDLAQGRRADGVLDGAIDRARFIGYGIDGARR